MPSRNTVWPLGGAGSGWLVQVVPPSPVAAISAPDPEPTAQPWLLSKKATSLKLWSADGTDCDCHSAAPLPLPLLRRITPVGGLVWVLVPTTHAWPAPSVPTLRRATPDG